MFRQMMYMLILLLATGYLAAGNLEDAAQQSGMNTGETAASEKKTESEQDSSGNETADEAEKTAPEQSKSAENNDDDTDLSRLRQRVKALEKQIETLSGKQADSDAAAQNTEQVETVKKLAERQAELEDRLDSVERSTLMDKLDFGLDFRATGNNYIYRDHSSGFNGRTAEDVQKNNGIIARDGTSPAVLNFRIRLKMRAELFDKMRFTGWLTTYKLFNGTNSEQYEDITDVDSGYYPDAAVYFERFYIDYFPVDWLSFTLGRCPTTDGYPYGLKNNTVPLGTYNEVFFNMPFDAFFTTINLQSLGVPDGYIRFLVSHSSFLDDRKSPNLISTDFVEESWYFGLLYDMRIPAVGSRLSFSTMYSPKMTFPIVNYENSDELSFEGNVSDVVVATTMVGFENIASSGLTIFGSHTFNILVPPDRTESDDGVVFAVDEETGEKIPLLAMFGRVDGKPQIGHMFYVGGQYSLPFTISGYSPKIGVDYNYGTKKFYNQYVPDTTGFRRFMTKGHFIDSYIIIPFHLRSHIKIGYIFKKSNYDESTPFMVIKDNPEHAVIPVDETIHNIYMMVEVSF